MGGEAGSNGRRAGPATARLTVDQPDAVERDAQLRRLFVQLDARGVAGAPRRSAAARLALCSVESLDRRFLGAFKRSYAKWIRRWRVEATVAARADGIKEDVAARGAGFRCASEFISAHVAEFGVTPSGLPPRHGRRRKRRGLIGGATLEARL